MTDRPARSRLGVGGAGNDTRSVSARVQAGFSDWAERPDVLPSRPRRVPEPRLAPPSAADVAAPDVAAPDVASLRSQLQVLRRQFDTAFADVDDRIDIAVNNAAAAAKVAEEAGDRAQAALDRAARMIAAAEALGAELHRLTPSLPDEVGGEVEAAVERFRSRLQSA